MGTANATHVLQFSGANTGDYIWDNCLVTLLKVNISHGSPDYFVDMEVFTDG